MSDYGDDDPYHVERGYKTDSYIKAVSGNLLTRPSYSGVASHSVLEEESERVEKETYGRALLILHREIEPTPAYGTLDADEVSDYRRDPFWKRFRFCCLLCCCLIWLLALLITLYVIVISPKCATKERDWWTDTVIYEIWTPSFRDSDADGHGDLVGITERFNKLRKLGAKAIYPRPFLKVDDAAGLGVVDFQDIQSELGSLKDATNFIEEAHKWDFKVIIDFPIAATSRNHRWFAKSSTASALENRTYANFYFWKRSHPVSEFVAQYGDADDVYYHVENHTELPVLNYNSPGVSKAIKEALLYWVDKGVDGFHLRFADYLARTEDGKHPRWDGIVRHITDLRKDLRTHLVEHPRLKDKKIFLFASMDDIGELEKLKFGKRAGLDAVLNSELLRIAVGNRICERTPDSISDCSNEVVGDILQFFQSGHDIWPIWQFGDANTERLATRTKSRLQSELLQMMLVLLPGTPVLYYGDEYGAKDAPDTPFPQRAAMAWDESSTSGFSDASALNWVAHLPSEWKQINFDSEMYNSQSRVRVIKRLIGFRNLYPILLDGATYLSKPVKNSFSLTRFWPNINETNKEAFVLSVNFGSRPINATILDLPPFVYAQHHLLTTADSYLEAEVLAVSSAVAARGYYWPRQKIDITSGQVWLGVDQGILYRFWAS